MHHLRPSHLTFFACFSFLNIVRKTRFRCLILDSRTKRFTYMFICLVSSHVLILLTCKKATEALIRRVNNYPDRPISGDAKILLSG